MKQKFLLSMLFGGALLAACTSDELDVAPVAQGVNPSAPVFSVSFEDGENSLTRASFSGGSVVYTGNDLMSLFHGIGTGFADGYQDAIYKAEGTENGLEFKTAAMVLPGKAVMVYPADTVSSKWEEAPTVAIPVNQNEDTVVYRPYVSPVLTIADRNEEGGKNTTKVNGVSGYDKKYDIKMKSAAGLLRITLNANMDELQKKLERAGVKATLAINSVELVNEDELFTTVMPIKMDSEYAEGKKPEGAKDYWTAPIGLAEEATEKSCSLRTSYIRNNTAIFSVLPFETDASFENLTLVAHTTFGDVTVTNETKVDEKYVVEAYTAYCLEENEELEDPISLSVAFDKLAENIYATTYTGTFKDEKAGQIVAMTVKMDMSTLNMNNMHIKDEAALETALNVYEALGIKEKIRLILDGTEGKFKMSEKTWKRVAKLMAEEEPKVTFAACNSEAPCTAIVLSNNEETNVPELTFDNNNYSTDGIKRNVNIELAEGTSWTFEGDREKTHLLGKVKDLIVQEDAVLNLTETTINVFNNMRSETDKFVLVNNGLVNISGTVYLMNNMTNHGTIEIPAEDENRFNMYSGGHLTNSEEQGAKATGWWTPADATDKLGNAGGVINNAGTLAIVQGATDASIVNRGTINIMNDDARTLITSNTTGEIEKPYNNAAQSGDDNVFGTINLKTKEAGKNKLSIATSGQDGFIKYVAEVGAECTLANYAVVTGETWPTGLAAKAYVEIKNNGKELQTPTSLTVDALIIPEGKSIFIAGGNKVVVKKYLYVKGSITRAGGLFTDPGTTDVAPSGTTYNYVGYFGGDKTKDKDNIFSMGQ